MPPPVLLIGTTGAGKSTISDVLAVLDVEGSSPQSLADQIVVALGARA